jgi:hypothetical protein
MPPKPFYPNRGPFGKKTWKWKITDAQVADIRARYEAGEQAIDLAAEFGISTKYVYRLGAGHGRIPTTPPPGQEESRGQTEG